MEHGKFSVSKIWHIAKMEYIKLIMDPRMILIVAALVFAYQFITVPLLQNAAMMGKPINVYEPFVALLNSNFMILLVPAVFLAIMSDYPRIDGNTLFVVQRAGKGNWFFGQILYAQMSILSYLLIVFVGMMIPVLWGGSFSAKWSPVVSEFAYSFPDYAQNTGSVSIPPEIYYHMSPAFAVFCGVLFVFLYLFLLSMILLLFATLGAKKAGVITGFLVIAAGICFCATSSRFKFLFPMANSLQRPYAEEDDGRHRKAEKAEQRVKIAVHIHLRDGEEQADRQRALEHILIRRLAKGLVQHADAAQKPAQQNHQKHRHRRVEGKDKAIHGDSLPSGLWRLPPRDARENVPLQNRV